MDFTPRKTITVQVSLGALQKLKDIAIAKGTTRTKIIEGMINQEYERTMKDVSEDHKPV